MKAIRCMSEMTVYLGNEGYLHIAESSDGWNIQISELSKMVRVGMSDGDGIHYRYTADLIALAKVAGQ